MVDNIKQTLRIDAKSIEMKLRDMKLTHTDKTYKKHAF